MTKLHWLISIWQFSWPQEDHKASSRRFMVLNEVYGWMFILALPFYSIRSHCPADGSSDLETCLSWSIWKRSTVSVRIRDIDTVFYIILLASNLHRRMVLNVIALFQLNWIKWTILLLGMLRCWLCVASTCVSKKIIYVLFVFQLHSFLFLITYNIDITKWSTIVWSPAIVPITYIQCEFQRMHSWAIIMLTLLRLSLNVMSCYLALVFFYINRCMLLLQVYPVFQ